MARVLHRAARTYEGGFAGYQLHIAGRDGRQSGHYDGSGRHVAAATGNFQPEGVGEAVALGFMHLDDGVRGGLVGDGHLWSDA